MGVGTEIGTVVVLGNESTENRSGRLSEMIEDIVSAAGDSGISCAEHITVLILTEWVLRKMVVEILHQ